MCGTWACTVGINNAREGADALVHDSHTSSGLVLCRLKCGPSASVCVHVQLI